MGREIKFRCFDKVCNCYVEEWKLYLNGGVSVEGVWATNDVILEQFTGLCDMKGISVYEGDILKVEQINGYPKAEIHIVIWTDDFATFGTDSDKLFDWLRYYDKFEVIGNIHENKTLLK